MQLVTIANFISVKKRISQKIVDKRYLKISSLNKDLRDLFVGKEVDSLYCKEVSKHVISTKISLGNIVTVFQTIT